MEIILIIAYFACNVILLLLYETDEETPKLGWSRSMRTAWFVSTLLFGLLIVLMVKLYQGIGD